MCSTATRTWAVFRSQPYFFLNRTDSIKRGHQKQQMERNFNARGVPVGVSADTDSPPVGFRDEAETVPVDRTDCMNS